MKINDLDLPQFASPEACKAACIDLDTLKNWSSRKPAAVSIGAEERIVVGGKMVRGKLVGGKTTLKFTLRRVLQLAITEELVRLGMSPRAGATAAFTFTDIEVEALPGRPARKRGELFRKHYTLLIVYSINHADVVNAKAEDMWRLVIKSGLGAPAKPTAAAIVNLNLIDRCVRSTLGLSLTAREGVVD